jgi:hypothetical protein
VEEGHSATQRHPFGPFHWRSGTQAGIYPGQLKMALQFGGGGGGGKMKRLIPSVSFITIIALHEPGLAVNLYVFSQFHSFTSC